MATPIISIYSLIGTPAEENKYLAFGLDEFRRKLQDAEMSGEKLAQLRINSVGGNLMDAQSMLGLMQASPLKFDTYCDGVAASAASVLFCGGKKRLIAAHGRLMVHNCSGPAFGKVSDLEKAIESQRAANESMAVLYANTTGLPIEQIRSMMEAETWLTAEQAVELGFATGIINNAKPAPQPAPELQASANLLQLQAFYAEHLPSTPSFNMKNLLLPLLTAAAVAGITAEATDEQVADAVKGAFDEIATLRANKEQADADLLTAQTQATESANKLQELEQKIAADTAAAQQQQISALVQGAVTEGRITADQTASYTALATADLAATTAVIKALPARKSLTEQITASADNPGAGLGKITAAGAMAEIRATQAKS